MSRGSRLRAVVYGRTVNEHVRTLTDFPTS